MLAPTRDGTWLHADAADVEARLRAADPRLSLILRSIDHPTKGTGHRYEVWRTNEEGQDVRLGHWRVDEFYQIEADIALMRGAVARPSDVAPVIDRIDKVNDALDKDNSDKIKDVLGQTYDHMTRLWHDRTQPKNTFRQVGGVGRDAS